MLFTYWSYCLLVLSPIGLVVIVITGFVLPTKLRLPGLCFRQAARTRAWHCVGLADGASQGNNRGNTIGNTIGNPIGNTIGNTMGNTIGNSIQKKKRFFGFACFNKIPIFLYHFGKRDTAILTARYIRSTFVRDQREFVQHF